MLKQLLFIFYSSIHFAAWAQPTITFQKCFGGSLDEGSSCINKTSEKGYIITGNTNSNNGDVSGCHGNTPDAWVFELDSNCNMKWQKCLGGTYYDGGISGVKTKSGFVIGAFATSIDGNITNNHGMVDFWFIKLDTAKNIIWQKCFGGSDSESGYDFAATPDGGFLISGTALSFDGDVIGHHGTAGANDFWIVKIDSVGNKVWAKCLGGSNVETWGYIDIDAVGNIYAVCSSNSRDGDVSCTGSSKYSWLVKLRADGTIIWDNCFGGSSGTDEIHSIRIYGNKLLMSGCTASTDFDLNHNYGYQDAWIVLTDTSGNLIFSKSFGGSSVDEFNDAVIANNGFIIAGGETYSTDYDVTHNHPSFGNSDGWLLCMDSLGNLMWQNTYGGYGDELISSLLVENNTLTILATSVLGNLGGTSGDVIGSHGGSDIWLVNMDLLTTVKNDEQFENWAKLFPNPFISEITIQLNIPFGNTSYTCKLMDLSGRNILARTNLTDSNFTINTESILPGLYLLELSAKSGKIVKKLVKI